MRRWGGWGVGLGVMVVSVSGSAIAQISQPDAMGDYARNETPLLGIVPAGSNLQPGSMWRVVSPGLNCRRQATVNAPIVRQFRAGDRLQAEVGRGGSDEVFLNPKDATGKPWMWVRSTTYRLEAACYVRANRRYIRPVTQR